MQAELTLRGPVSFITEVSKFAAALWARSVASAEHAEEALTEADDVEVDGATAPTDDVEAVRRVRARCGKTWPYVQQIAAVFQSGEQLTLADIADRTKIKMRKVHSIWNVLGRPLKSQNVRPFFVWVKGSAPKAFTLSDAAKVEILIP